MGSRPLLRAATGGDRHPSRVVARAIAPIVAGGLLLASIGAVSAGCAPVAPSTVAPPTTSRPTAPPPPPPAAPPAPPPAPLVDRAAVAAETEAAVEVGARVLERGGSAIDAAVAMAFASAVVQPSSCGLGGGGFAIAWDPARREASVVDFRETSPGGLRLKDHLGRAPRWERRGVMAGVPGLVRGLADLHAAGGRLPLARVIEPAAELAEGGFRVEPWLAQALAWEEATLRRDPRLASALLGPGGVPAAGDELANPALGRTLRAIAEGGPDAFYRGPIAEDVVATARAAGSAMVVADLAGYAAVRRSPVRVAFAGRDVLVPPPPSGGGVVLAQQLVLFPEADLRRLALGSADQIHLGAEGLRASTADRRSWVGDPAFTRIPELLLDPARLATIRASLPPRAATAPAGPPLEDGGTCHVVAWDDAGGVVSLSASVGGMFGSKLVTQGGFLLGEALADFAHDPHGQKVVTKGPNFPRAGARPASSLAPALVLEGGVPELALGASGGARAPSAILQVLQRAIVGGEPLAQAIAAPRWYAPSSGGLQIEEGLAPLAGELAARGEALEAPRPSFAAVTAVRVRRAGQGQGPAFEATSDPRKAGRARILRGPPPR